MHCLSHIFTLMNKKYIYMGAKWFVTTLIYILLKAFFYNSIDLNSIHFYLYNTNSQQLSS